MAKLIVGVNDLATVNPKLAKEWNYEKNDKLPQEYTSGSGAKVWWRGKCNHEWKTSIVNRIKGTGCPYCATFNSKVLVGYNDLATQNTLLADEWNYERNEKTPQDYRSDSGAMVWWKCSKGHEWQARIDHRNDGVGCPYCKGKLPIVGETDLATLYPNLVKEWSYEKNDNLPEDYTKGSEEKVWWVCSKGHEWQASISNRTRNKSNCPYCSGLYPIIGETDLATVNPDLVKEWNYEKNDKLPQEYTSGSNQKVWWKCKEGHEWQARICNRNIHNRGCHYCSGNKVLQGFNDLETKNPLLAKEWNYDKNDKLPQDYTSGSGKKVWWKCTKGHEWIASIEKRNHGRNCPYCSGSKAERLTYKILKEWNISFRAEKKFEGDFRVQYYPYDIWISKYGLIIELDGIQHFTKQNEYFERNIPIEKRVEHDNIKNQFALEKRIPLLRIPYTYNPDTEEEKIRQILKEFIETRKIPQEIIEYYEQYDFSNYSQIAKEMNEL